MGKKSKIGKEGKCKPCRLAGVAERERSVERESPDGGWRLRSGVGGHGRLRKPKAWGGGREGRAVGGETFFIWGLKG
ncbi:hypothetical protein FH972_012947 [Carpinus fangiana]|uniref:Uncharacterized protein n=1 Tax=Carpinus fangiana TaxID=176857 RepID=A0A5N6R8F4_9ROSI|nr:hypothetical protein FH972_012947 [Carpinus fangiana]